MHVAGGAHCHENRRPPRRRPRTYDHRVRFAQMVGGPIPPTPFGKLQGYPTRSHYRRCAAVRVRFHRSISQRRQPYPPPQASWNLPPMLRSAYAPQAFAGCQCRICAHTMNLSIARPHRRGAPDLHCLGGGMIVPSASSLAVGRTATRRVTLQPPDPEQLIQLESQFSISPKKLLIDVATADNGTVAINVIALSLTRLRSILGLGRSLLMHDSMELHQLAIIPLEISKPEERLDHCGGDLPSAAEVQPAPLQMPT